MCDNRYKFDSRTEEQFIKELEEGLKREADAINTFRKILAKSAVENPEVVYVGSSKEGEVLFDENNHVANVDVFPDYLLKYKVNRRIRAKFIEVKICNPHSQEAYFKTKQLEQYRDLGNVIILFVMGYNTDNPEYVLVEPEEVLEFDIEPEIVYGKKTIKVPVDWFIWRPFTYDDSHAEGNILDYQYINSNIARYKDEDDGTKVTIAQILRSKIGHR